MTGKRSREWIFPEDPDRGQWTGAKIHPVIGALLAGRGIVEKEEVREFLSDRPQLTWDPFLLKDMDAAVGRILDALENGRKICIYGDYDADGVTSCSLLLTVLGKLTENLSYYIPSRFDEGYGLNEEAMRTLAADGVKLMITVDCGSVSWKEVELAKELGMEVIVTDHHNLNGGKAADCLLINPKQEACGYPFKELAGCGVAFKLSQALQKRLAEKDDARLLKSDVTDLLDLVAVSTIGDIVPLISENRSLVKYGLNVLNQGKRPGLRALVEGVGLELGKIKSEQVAYVIVPHLNAAGRMVSAAKGVELLTSRGTDPKSVEERREAVDFLVENNKERKRIQEETFQECMGIVGEKHPDDLFQVIYAEDAHEGIAGIVAGKIKDTCYRPVIITTPSGEGCVKGTGRSLEGIDLYGMLAEYSQLFERFGGHSGACGFLMKEEYLETLRIGLNEGLTAQLAAEPYLLTEMIRVDGVLSPTDLTMAFLSEAARLGPFGHKNPEPLFAMKDVSISKVFYMGERKQHVRFLASKGGASVNCVLFQKAEEYGELLRAAGQADIAGYPGINVWNGTAKIQFVIRDMK